MPIIIKASNYSLPDFQSNATCPYAVICPILQTSSNMLENIIQTLWNLKNSETPNANHNGKSKYISPSRGKFNPDSLFRLRRQHQLSREDLAYLLGVDLLTINNWKNGQSTPTLRMQKRISAFEATGTRRIRTLLLSKIKQVNQQIIEI